LKFGIFQIENVVRPFILSDEDYKKIMGLMLESFNKGLGKDTNETAAVKMFPTYVRAVPDGSGMLTSSFLYILIEKYKYLQTLNVDIENNSNQFSQQPAVR